MALLDVARHRRPLVDSTADVASSPLPGLVLTTAGVGAALGLHALVPAVGSLTWAIAVGAVLANLGLVHDRALPGVRVASRRLLRAGIVLLGLSLPLATVAALGPEVLVLIVLTVAVTFTATLLIAGRMGLSGPRGLLLATGFSICGASAIAAMERTADAEDDDVATAIAAVTLLGTVTMVALPLLQGPLGLGDAAYGTWVGAGVQEVGQVVAAAQPAGAAVVGVAVAVKLTRVLLLAPVVAAVGLQRRRALRTSGRPTQDGLPPLVPAFVLGFLGCVLLRSTGVLPAPVLTVAEQAQTVLLAAALFALGTGVHLPRLLRSGVRPLLVGTAATAVVLAVPLAGVLLL
ncbi:putative sulfate exporter family transporter [Nocardioidaceae bacterium]|nr:putative sulfate exporter family transporter [Nocardioidaceae bacterium]